MVLDTKFHHFEADVRTIDLPAKFTFPFYYTPHTLSVIAAQSLMARLESMDTNEHRFGLDGDIGVGKMFGVLVVKNQENQLGYLCAFSGKLMGGNHYDGFVPPVFDTLDPEGFYKIGESKINELSAQILELEHQQSYRDALHSYEQLEIQYLKESNNLKEEIIAAKGIRQEKRLAAAGTVNEETVKEQLDKESIRYHYFQKTFNKEWKERLATQLSKIRSFEDTINALRDKRRSMSAALQEELFKKYNFLNAKMEYKSLNDIFSITKDNTPPSGAGECAAPKLLHYAYTQSYKPIALAEFWWGKSPYSEIRKHKQYYHACKGKCEPILSHMLQGLEVEDNPMLLHPSSETEIPILFEDDHIAVIDKPIDLLSVPGRQITDSVYTRMKSIFPDAIGPIIVHRLDMSTSGLMLIAKTKQAYHHLQTQFIKRLIKKRYEAVLVGELDKSNGDIKLPIRVDLDDRPRQMVCYDHGRPAHTYFEKVGVKDGLTFIHFYPYTGRTHQLRVHASHHLGLGLPIKGDDLYGTKAERLFLHAAEIEFTHPHSKMKMTFKKDSGFFS